MDPLFETPRRFRHLFKERSAKSSDKMALPPPVQTATGLDPYDQPLSFRESAHLFRRATFGGSVEQVREATGQLASQVTKQIIQEGLERSAPDPPSWREEWPPWGGTEADKQAYFDKQFGWASELVAVWMTRMVTGGLRDRMMLFWHDHFATERDTYFYSILAYKYLSTLHKHALGNFRDFTIAVGIDPSMLVYLDGRLSTRQSPNENYARELLELFTMGEFDRYGNPNYIQTDIVELSRALTGYQVNYTYFTAHLTQSLRDNKEKTILGRTGKFNFGGAHRVLFEERPTQIAYFMASKLYTEFVYVTPHEAVVEELAQCFIDHDFEIAPVLEALFSSQHFYSEEVIGAQVKSPTALFAGLFRAFGQGVPERSGWDRIRWWMEQQSQRLLDPPNVAGWPGYRTWISTSSLPQRWSHLTMALWPGQFGSFKVNAVTITRELVDSNDPMAVFKVPVALAEFFLAVPLESIVIDAPPEFAGDLMVNPIPDEVQNGPDYVLDLTRIFLRGFPWYSWDLNRQGIAYQTMEYVRWLVGLPEYQLM